LAGGEIPTYTGLLRSRKATILMILEQVMD